MTKFETLTVERVEEILAQSWAVDAISESEYDEALQMLSKVKVIMGGY